jgi:hypothetical protein
MVNVPNLRYSLVQLEIFLKILKSIDITNLSPESKFFTRIKNYFNFLKIRGKRSNKINVNNIFKSILTNYSNLNKL